jgi:hypothetical protein
MSSLDLAPRIAAPDAFLAALTDRMRELDEGQTRAFTARLILLLANQVGDAAALAEAIEIAGRGLAPQPSA